MFKNRKRAIRRHHRERMIQRVMKYDLVRFYWDWGQVDLIKDRKRATQFYNHAAVCSCWMCGNPRRHKWPKEEQITMQERKSNDIYKEELEQLE